MSNRRQSKISRFWIALGLATGTFGGKCSGVPTDPSTIACTSNVAQMSIWDGRLQKICNCGGIDGEFSLPHVALNCTVALGTTVFVYYQGPFLQHQFVSDGTPTLPTGPVFDPSAKQPIRAHAFTPTAAGVYNFKDEYDNSIMGTLTVTP